MISAPSSSTLCGLEERAIEEFERAEALKESDDIRQITELGRLSLKTEELFRAQLGVTVHADNGMVSAGRHTYSARWLEVAGFTRWRLCLIERCVDCGAEVASPFDSPAALGAVLKARQCGAARCANLLACVDRRRGSRP